MDLIKATLAAPVIYRHPRGFYRRQRRDFNCRPLNVVPSSPGDWLRALRRTQTQFHIRLLLHHTASKQFEMQSCCSDDFEQIGCHRAYLARRPLRTSCEKSFALRISCFHRSRIAVSRRGQLGIRSKRAWLRRSIQSLNRCRLHPTSLVAPQPLNLPPEAEDSHFESVDEDSAGRSMAARRGTNSNIPRCSTALKLAPRTLVKPAVET